MLKAIGLDARLTRNLVLVTILLLLMVGAVATAAILPVEAAALAQGQEATPTPSTMMDHGVTDKGMTEHGMMGSGISMAGMDAMMEQMMAQMHSMMGTMPMSGTMPISDAVPMAGMMPMCAMMHTANSMPMMDTMPVSGTMPISGTMPMADMGMMMQMMGMMQMHMGCMHMMMGAMMSDHMIGEGMMGSGMRGNYSVMEMPSDLPFDALFIDGMIEHHQGAIDMAEMALEQAEREEVHTYAEEIIAAQAAEIEQLQSWRSGWYPDLEPQVGMHTGTGDMISDDETLPFDQRFLEAMTSHHQGAIDMAVMALEEAEHEELRTLAEKIIVAQTAETHHMQGWWTEWYGTAE